MARYLSKLQDHLSAAAIGYELAVSDDYQLLEIQDLMLPPGFNWGHTEVLIELPDDYPLSPPGIGKSHVYLLSGLRYRGRKLRDLHEHVTPGWGDWAWFCYQSIEWDPHRDDLVTFLEVVRADLTNPPT